MVAPTCNPNTQEAEAKGSKVQGQPRLQLQSWEPEANAPIHAASQRTPLTTAALSWYPKMQGYPESWVLIGEKPGGPCLSYTAISREQRTQGWAQSIGINCSECKQRQKPHKAGRFLNSCHQEHLDKHVFHIAQESINMTWRNKDSFWDTNMPAY
jgi:hypothetical protein